MLLSFRGGRAVSAMLALAATAVSLAQEPEFVWRYSTPEEQGVDSALLAQMVAQVQRDQMALNSFVLVRHEKVVCEAYIYPYAAAVKHPMYSVSKSFTSALIGIAIEQGLFGGVDDRVQDIFDGVTTQPLAERMSRMRLRHLLSMSTGHTTDTTTRITNTTNWERTFMELPVEAEPGSVFVYNSGGSYMLAAAIQRKAGMTALEYAQRNLFGPLGITDYTWDRSPSDVICGGWGLSLRSLDMARFGLMYLHRGKWNGRQVVPEAWVAECSRQQMSNGTGGFWGSGYGFQFWLNDFGGYRADGARAQYIFILPDYDAVAVFTCDLASDTERPGRLMRSYVLPAMRGATALPANPRGDAVVTSAAEVAGRAFSAGHVPPGFLVLPADQTVNAGETATFTLTASGSPAPTVQWFRDEIAIAGATAATLTIANAEATSAGEYSAVLRSSVGALASYPVTLKVLAAPAIVSGPVSVVAAEGGEAVFQVAAAGDELGFEWRHDGVAVVGATTRTLRISNVATRDAGGYRVVVRNGRGSVESAVATLTVAARDERARLVNLSARARAGLSDQTLMAGLVINGGNPAAALPVLLRGVGPTLKDFGVTEALADPTARLFRNGAIVAGNGDWKGEASLQVAAERTGATALAGTSADAAMQLTLRPGVYSMHVGSSLPDRTGVALAECYDASGETAVGGPRLVNLSARAMAAGGDDVLIGGFVIAGRGTLRVLIRGIGPTLGGSGVAGALADPEVRLFHDGQVIASNDDWAGDATLKAAFASTGAFGLADEAKDAALLVELPAGVYSAHVSGKGGAAGVAMVEIYAVP